MTHRKEYLRGQDQGRADAAAGRDYRPRGAATGTESERQDYGLGYEGGWEEGNPCSNGTCDHLAHQREDARDRFDMARAAADAVYVPKWLAAQQLPTLADAHKAAWTAERERIESVQAAARKYRASQGPTWPDLKSAGD